MTLIEISTDFGLFFYPPSIVLYHFFGFANYIENLAIHIKSLEKQEKTIIL